VSEAARKKYHKPARILAFALVWGGLAVWLYHLHVYYKYDETPPLVEDFASGRDLSAEQSWTSRLFDEGRRLQAHETDRRRVSPDYLRIFGRPIFCRQGRGWFAENAKTLGDKTILI